MDQASQARIQMKMQFNMVKSCFGDCVNSFNAGDLSSAEKTCLANCGARGLQSMQIFGQISQQMESKQGGMNGF